MLALIPLFHTIIDISKSKALPVLRLARGSHWCPASPPNARAWAKKYQVLSSYMAGKAPHDPWIWNGPVCSWNDRLESERFNHCHVRLPQRVELIEPRKLMEKEWVSEHQEKVDLWKSTSAKSSDVLPQWLQNGTHKDFFKPRCISCQF